MTAPFRKILFPVDFSDRAAAVAPAVYTLAQKHNADLTILHALELPPGAYADWYAFSAMVDVDALRAHQRSLLDNFAPGAPASVTVERVMLDGPPVPTIVNYATLNGFDLIALPTHGFGAFRSLLLGSITAGVLHDTHVPVWTAAHAETLEEHREPHRILCAIDLAPSSQGVLEWAQKLANFYQAELRVVHAIPQVYDPVQAFSADDFRHYLMQQARERYAPVALATNVAAPLTMVEGGVGHAIGDEAKSFNADLLVIGRGVIHHTFGRLRTHAYDLIRSSPCPVLSI